MAAKKKAKAKKKAPRQEEATEEEEGPAKKTKVKPSPRRRKTVAKKSKKAPAKRQRRKPRPSRPGGARDQGGEEGRDPGQEEEAKKQIVGEGDYAASRKFDADQAGFVKKNKAKIPEMGKEAEKALDGPEGDSLRDAEAEAAGHSRDTFDA